MLVVSVKEQYESKYMARWTNGMFKEARPLCTSITDGQRELPSAQPTYLLRLSGCYKCNVVISKQ